MKKIILLSIIVTLIASCSIEYFPTTYNAPLFTDMEQFESTVNVGNNGFDAQIAFAPINHFGFIATGSYADRNSDDNEDDLNLYNSDFHKHLFGEMGLGFFTGMGSKGSFEIYGGYGHGRTEGYDDSWDYDYDKATYSKYFIQPEIGITNKVFEGALVTRLSLIDMSSIVNDYRSTVAFMEPGVVFKVGYEYIKFYTQLGFSLPIAMDAEDMKYNYSFFNFSFGLNFSFGNYNNK
jgi:hypothetical protein